MRLRQYNATAGDVVTITAMSTDLDAGLREILSARES